MRGIVALFVSSLCAASTSGCGSRADVRSTAARIDVIRDPFPFPQGLARSYDTSRNLAFSGNGYASPAVARDCIPDYAPIHLPGNANDGFMGNGASWISDSWDSWVKIDLGRSVPFDTFRGGRDRTGYHSDRPWGRFRLYATESDDVYANGNDANDDVEYALVYDSLNDPTYDGIDPGETVVATFAPVQARYVKLVVERWGAAVDEIEIQSSAHGVVRFEREGYRAPGTAVVTVTDSNAIAAHVRLKSTAASKAVQLNLDATGVGGVFRGSVPLWLSTPGAMAPQGSLEVSSPDTITVEYNDLDDGTLNPDGTPHSTWVTPATAVVDNSLPDLAVTALAGSPLVWLIDGETLAVSYTVANRGGAASGDTEVAFYLSSDASFDPAKDVLVGSAAVGAIPSDGSISAGLTIALSPGLYGGDYRLVGVVDPSNAIHELNEDDDATIATGGVRILNDTVRAPFGHPQGLARPYHPEANLAWPGNGAQPAVARDCIPGHDAIHRPEYANDGWYGNGSSWVADSYNSWLKIDLGAQVWFDTFRGGRDRTGYFGDRAWGRFQIFVASADSYANGDDANDDVEYGLPVYDSLNDPAYDGIGLGETVVATFAPVQARYVKLVVEGWGAAVDEIEIVGSTP